MGDYLLKTSLFDDVIEVLSTADFNAELYEKVSKYILILNLNINTHS